MDQQRWIRYTYPDLASGRHAHVRTTLEGKEFCFL